MSDKAKTMLIGVVSLVIGAAIGGSYGMMQVDEVNQKLIVAMQEKEQAALSADRLRKMNDDAAKKYGESLGKLVAAVPADDPAKLIDSVRAILAIRDGFRASLDGARASMDTEFDALATELGNAAPNADKVKQLVDGLKQNWPAKGKGMEDATRKLLADLGLSQATAAPKQEAAPVPAPAPAAPAEKK